MIPSITLSVWLTALRLVAVVICSWKDNQGIARVV